MKKILMLCYKRPYPLKSGAEVRMFQFIEILSACYSIDVIYISDENNENDKLDKICNKVIRFKSHKSTQNIRAVKNYIFRGMPLQVGQLYYKQPVNWLHEHYKEYERIICFHIKMAPYIMNLVNTNKKNDIFFDGTDSITLQSYNSYKANKGWKKFAYLIEYKRMKKYEKKVYEAIKHTILISERDKSYIINKVKAKCSPELIFNYAIDLGYKEKVNKEDYSIVFMGKMDYSPNVKAVTYFIENIYEEIRTTYKKTQFHIIGGNVPEEIKKYDGAHGIHVHGFVDDAASFLQKSTIVIAPMRSGAGMQNKIVQAMYLGCTVITSKIGADGLTNLSNNELIIYENDKDFINKIKYYLSKESEKARYEIGICAQQYVQQNYSYQAIQEKILHVIKAV